MKKYTFEDISSFLDSYELKGSTEDKTFTKVDSALEADSNSLVWVNKNKQELAENTSASFILCHPTIDVTPQMQQEKCYIIVDNPKQVFTNIVEEFFAPDESLTGIHSTSIIHPDAEIHESAAIGAFCIIGKCIIGEGVQIRDYCKIHDGVKIGRNVNIYEHCLLGGTGFGFAIDDDSGELTHMPHIGGLEIGDYVDLYPYVNVDRGTLGNTKIGNGTKIDHYCHIGHNTVIGEHCIITAQVVTCGSSSIGARTWVGVGSIIKQSIRIGSKVVIGLGSVVTKNVPDGETWLGVPAQEISEFMRISKLVKNL